MRKIKYLIALCLAVALITCGCSNQVNGNTATETTTPPVASTQSGSDSVATPDATLAEAGEVRVGDDGTGSYDPDNVVVPDLPQSSDDDQGSTDHGAIPAEEPGEEELAPGTHEGEPPMIEDDQVAYSPEDIQQWLSPNERVVARYNFDLGQMLADIWGYPTWGERHTYNVAGVFEFYFPNGDYRVVTLSGVVGSSFYKAEIVSGIKNNDMHIEYVSSVEKTYYDPDEDYYYVFGPTWIQSIDADFAALIFEMAKEVERNPRRDNVLSGRDIGENFNAY